MAIESVESSAAATVGTTSSTKLSATFDTFLTLLTTQLQNQDPLDPVDSAEFTNQLVAFTQAEQAIATNQNLESLIALIKGNNTTNSLGYLGTIVEAAGEKAALVNGSATWGFELPINSAQTTVTIADETGLVVATANATTEKGTHNFVWDGLSDQGVPQPDGIYTITVAAKDTEGQKIPVVTAIQGTVDGVEVEDGNVILSLGGIRLPIEEVRSIKQPQIAAATPDVPSTTEPGTTEPDAAVQTDGQTDTQNDPPPETSTP